MTSSNRWLIPTVAAAAVAVAGWVFIGFDKRQQARDLQSDDVANFEAQVSPLDDMGNPGESLGAEQDSTGTSDSAEVEVRQWTPKTIGPALQKQYDSITTQLTKPGKRADAIRQLEKIASAGYDQAMTALGNAYLDSKYSTFSQPKAYAWFTVAEAFGAKGLEAKRARLAEEMEAPEIEAAHAKAGVLLNELKKRIGQRVQEAKE